MADTIITFGEDEAIVNGYNVLMRFIPTVTRGAAKDLKDILEVYCTSKTLPGFEAAESWPINSDNPNVTIPGMEVGRSGAMSPLPFETYWNAKLVNLLTIHSQARSQFTIVYEHDDTNQDFTQDIEIPGCRCMNVSPATFGNASAPLMNFTFQKTKAQMVTDGSPIKVTETPRA